MPAERLTEEVAGGLRVLASFCLQGRNSVIWWNIEFKSDFIYSSDFIVYEDVKMNICHRVGRERIVRPA